LNLHEWEAEGGWLVIQGVEGPASLLFQMFSLGHLRMQTVDSTQTHTYSQEMGGWVGWVFS